MLKALQKSILLLVLAIVICCGIYPLALWIVAQILFPFQANGSILPNLQGKPVGSLLIAQPFTKEGYFHPRPSAASYDAAASASSSLAASNYALRNRVARALGPIVKYRNGIKAGQLVASDVETWFQQDRFAGKEHIVAQWAMLHQQLAQAWVSADPLHEAYVNNWAKTHQSQVSKLQENSGKAELKPVDLAIVFFQNFSTENPGKFPSLLTTLANGKTTTAIEPVNRGPDIQAIFFDMWRQAHPETELEDVPADMVTTSGSGLDPHITLQNAFYQLEQVSGAWANKLKRNQKIMRTEVKHLLNKKAFAPCWGLAGEKLVNVLEINLALHKRYGAP
jgi:potassium-transporting ATPase KdpC subunit